MSAAIVALLGRADAPTDGVRDFVERLGDAVERQGHPFLIARLPAGRAARPRLTDLVDRHPGAWFVLQYTALQWSAWAMPVEVPAMLRLIRRRRGHPGIVFHDIAPYPGSRPVARLRHLVQRRVMRRSAATAAQAFIAGQHQTGPSVPAGFAGWVPPGASLRFLPVGSILPPWAPPPDPPRARRANGRARVGVFGISDHRAHIEVPQIAEVLRQAQDRLGPLELAAFGRGTAQARPLFGRCLPPGIDARVLGVLPPDALLAEMRELDALLFVRHHLSAQRSSAMAAVSAGVPIVGFRGPFTDPSLEDWGVRLTEEGRLAEAARHLADVISDADTWRALSGANLAVARTHLDWDVIAARFLGALER